jgi:hypothetical protein
MEKLGRTRPREQPGLETTVTFHLPERAADRGEATCLY